MPQTPGQQSYASCVKKGGSFFSLPGAPFFGLRRVGPFSHDCRGPMAAVTSHTCPVLILPIYVVPTIDRNRELVWRESGQNSATQSRVTGLPVSSVSRAPVFGVPKPDLGDQPARLALARQSAGGSRDRRYREGSLR